MQQVVILLRPDAPTKPDLGQPCNGCGVCCAYAPCPMGMLLSRRRRGACKALMWHDANYRCGVLVEPGRYLPWLPAGVARRLTARWIGAAKGCDADIVVS